MKCRFGVEKNWLNALSFDASYDVDDLLPAIRSGLSVDGKLYAAPFYGESSMIMYRKDLVAKAGMTMPQQPTWGEVYDIAKAITEGQRRCIRCLSKRKSRLG